MKVKSDHRSGGELGGGELGGGELVMGRNRQTPPSPFVLPLSCPGFYPFRRLGGVGVFLLFPG